MFIARTSAGVAGAMTYIAAGMPLAASAAEMDGCELASEGSVTDSNCAVFDDDPNGCTSSMTGCKVA